MHCETITVIIPLTNGNLQQNLYIKAAFDKGILSYLTKGLIFLNMAMKSEAYNQILSARH